MVAPFPDDEGIAILPDKMISASSRAESQGAAGSAPVSGANPTPANHSQAPERAGRELQGIHKAVNRTEADAQAAYGGIAIGEGAFDVNDAGPFIFGNDLD